MSRLRPPKGCIFCGGGGLSREHLWPVWAAQILPRTNGYTQVSLGQAAASSRTASADAAERRFERQGRITDVRLRVVCQSCNNGWMSQLEQSARPLVTALILGLPHDASAEMQRYLAQWITLKLIIADASPGSAKVFLRDERREFFEHRTIPEPLTVQVYRCGMSPWSTIFHATSTKAAHSRDEKPHADNLKAFLFGAGEALFHAIYGRDLNVASASNPGLTLSLVPIAGAFSWPPPQRLSADRAYTLASELSNKSSPAFRWATG